MDGLTRRALLGALGLATAAAAAARAPASEQTWTLRGAAGAVSAETIPSG